MAPLEFVQLSTPDLESSVAFAAPERAASSRGLSRPASAPVLHLDLHRFTPSASLRRQQSAAAPAPSSPSMMRSGSRAFVRPSSGLHRGGASTSALHRPASAAKKARPAYDPRMIRPASAAPKTPAAAKLDRLLADEKAPVVSVTPLSDRVAAGELRERGSTNRKMGEREVRPYSAGTVGKKGLGGFFRARESMLTATSVAETTESEKLSDRRSAHRRLGLVAQRATGDEKLDAQREELARKVHAVVSTQQQRGFSASNLSSKLKYEVGHNPFVQDAAGEVGWMEEARAAEAADDDRSPGAATNRTTRRASRGHPTE